MQGTHTIDLVRHRPAPALDGLVAGMVGMSERAPDVVRRQPAGTLLPLVISFGKPLSIRSLTADPDADSWHGSFVAGLSASPVLTRFEGGQDCVQVYLTPIGVSGILGVPGSAVAHSVFAPGEVVGDLGDALADHLSCVTTWQERFDLVERVLIRQRSREEGPRTPAWVSWMWSEIRMSGGRARIGDLVAATDWSHRHVASVFGEYIGMTPKQLAGVVRFERASADLGRLPLAEIAARHGYADQSHLTRDVGRYAGETPSQLASARRPTAWTALGSLPQRA